MSLRCAWITCLLFAKAAWEWMSVSAVEAGYGKIVAYPEAEAARVELAMPLVGSGTVPVREPKEMVRPKSEKVSVRVEARLKS